MNANPFEYETNEYHAQEVVANLRQMANEMGYQINRLREFAEKVEAEIVSGTDFSGTLFGYNVTELVTGVLASGTSNYPARNAIIEAQKASV